MDNHESEHRIRETQDSSAADRTRREFLLPAAGAGGLLRTFRKGQLLRAGADGRGRLRLSLTEEHAGAADAAWDDLSRLLFEFISRRVRRREDAEDVLQEVMLRIHRHRDDVTSAEAVTGWIYRIARNAIIDHYRRAAMRHEVPVGDGIEEAASLGAPLDEEEPSSAELREELARCLAPLANRLPEKYREAVVMTEFEGVSQVDAARSLGLSVSGMKARVQRGRKQLKAMLLECCEVELDRRGAIADYSSHSGNCGC